VLGRLVGDPELGAGDGEPATPQRRRVFDAYTSIAANAAW